MPVNRLLWHTVSLSVPAAIALAMASGNGPWVALRGAVASDVESGLVAISMRGPDNAVVMQADGRVLAFDTARGVIVGEVYRVPRAFNAVDLAAGTWSGRSIICFSVNRQSVSERGGFLLQVFPNKTEIWAQLPTNGVYVGVALDAQKGVVYVGNSSNNVVYRVRLGHEKGAVSEVTTLGRAERIGAMAVDEAGEQLFISDMSLGELYVVALAQPHAVKSIPLPEVKEVRAVAWSPRDGRVYLADSGQETVWSVGVPPAPAQLKRLPSDAALRAPAGLTAAADGTLWLVDGRTRTAFQLSPETLRIVRRVSWSTARY